MAAKKLNAKNIRHFVGSNFRYCVNFFVVMIVDISRLFTHSVCFYCFYICWNWFCCSPKVIKSWLTSLTSDNIFWVKVKQFIVLYWYCSNHWGARLGNNVTWKQTDQSHLSWSSLPGRYKVYVESSCSCSCFVISLFYCSCWCSFVPMLNMVSAKF